ncbi:hypothetical protein ES703_45697 [subsurface metagenome]
MKILPAILPLKALSLGYCQPFFFTLLDMVPREKCLQFVRFLNITIAHRIFSFRKHTARSFILLTSPERFGCLQRVSPTFAVWPKLQDYIKTFIRTI